MCLAHLSQRNQSHIKRATCAHMLECSVDALFGHMSRIYPQGLESYMYALTPPLTALKPQDTQQPSPPTQEQPNKPPP